MCIRDRYIRERLPLCEAVSMYASIRSVADKTDADLAELKALGLGKLYIGVESGCDEILEEMHKGHTEMCIRDRNRPAHYFVL